MAKLEFETNIPAVVRFPFGGEPKTPEPTEYGSYYYGVEVDGERMNLYATELLHRTIEAAAIERGDEATITKGEKKSTGKDGKPRKTTVWKIEYGAEAFASDALPSGGTGQPAPKPAPAHSQPAPAPDPGPAQGPSPAPDESPPQEQPPHSVDPAHRNGNGHRPGPISLTFKQACRELACTMWVAGKMANHTGALLGRPISEVTLFIELRKMGQRPDEDTLKDWAVARPVPTPTGPGPSPDTPAGSSPIGAEGYFVLLDAASAAKITHAALHTHMAQAWRAALKMLPDGPLPRRGMEVDYTLFPETLANDVSLWIEEQDRNRAQENQEAK